MPAQTPTQPGAPAPRTVSGAPAPAPRTVSGPPAPAPRTVPGGFPAEATVLSRIRAYYTSVDAGDVESLLALFAPDARYHRPGYEPLVGHTALRRFYQGERIIAEGTHTLTETVVDGDRAAVHGEFHGLLRTGERVDLRFADFFTLTSELTFATRDTFFFTPLV